MTPSARKGLLRGADLFPGAVGGVLLAIGVVRGRPSLSLVGGLVLAAVGLVNIARLHGYVVPRPGRKRIATCGCWEVPLAFLVRHRRQTLLFHRAFESAGGILPDDYSVIALPDGCDQRFSTGGGFEPPEDSRLIGSVPTRELRFEHRGGHFVDAASLSAALRRIAGASANWP